MIKFPSIEQYYRPIQPSVQGERENIRYTEILPDPKLQSLICCYWQLKSELPRDSHFSYKVVADGCIDVFFEMDNPAENYVMGFATSSTEFPLGSTFHYIGIRFFPTVFPQLFRIDASGLTNHYEHLGNAAPDISRFISTNFETLVPPVQIKTQFDNYFIKHLQKQILSPDKRINQALEIILKRGGNLTLNTDLDIGLSNRQLRRLFHRYVGGSVKTFSKIIRFQNVLKASIADNMMPGVTSFYDAGYYDQAHFIREFRTLYGSTPGSVLKP